jgi:hypothetical protein
MTSWFSSAGRSEFLPKRVPDPGDAARKTNVSQERGGGKSIGCFDDDVVLIPLIRLTL